MRSSASSSVHVDEADDDSCDSALDAFEQSLTSLFDHVVPLHGSPNQIFTYTATSREDGPVRFEVFVPPQQKQELFAHHVWNSSLVLADKISLGEIQVREQSVLELGAGAGIPSLVSAVCGGAKQVLVTDFDDPAIVANLKRNVETVVKHHNLDHAAISAQGFTWGSSPGKVLASSHDGQGFDVILLADCIWNGFAHDVLVESLSACLRNLSTSDADDDDKSTSRAPRVELVSGFHSGRACVRKFLRKAAEVGLVESGEWSETSVDKRTRAWGWDLGQDGSEPEHEVEAEAERNKWVVTGQLEWRR
ncbi:hypothetical protein ACM66B_000178 [Microbotryomycetes sp. NB124-2]